jgi:tRNA-dihydrouridine synthase A
MNNHLISVAPMMDWTDRHCRYLMRLISPQVLLYTEMVTCGAILRGRHANFLAYNPEEHPLVLQLGGSDPHALAQCARIAEDWGYDAVNLNVGCPSDRVQAGRFGACLLREPTLVAECVAAMQAQVKIPITVKTRIGVDEMDSYDFLHQFVQTVATAGCRTFIIHARKAWLQGLSPKENRTIPPIDYPRVYQLKQAMPQLEIIINGEIKTLSQVRAHLQQVDGVMIGRQAYQTPYVLAEMTQGLYTEAQLPSRREVVAQYTDYMQRALQQGVSMRVLLKPLLGLFHAMPGGKHWRRQLSDNNFLRQATPARVKQMLTHP